MKTEANNAVTPGAFQNPAVSGAIVSARNAEQVENNIGGSIFNYLASRAQPVSAPPPHKVTA